MRRIKAGVKLMLFANREFEASDIDDLLEQLEDLRDRSRSAARLSDAPSQAAPRTKG